MEISSLSERFKIILLSILLAILAVLIAPLIPAEHIPRSCLLTRVKGEVERWVIEEEKIVLRFKQPTQRALAEWRDSGISDEIIALNLISIPDYACDPVTGKAIDSIPEILQWNRSGFPSEYRSSSLREAWTYTGYNPMTQATSTQFELKPQPIIRKKPIYRKYESTRDNPPIGYLRTSSRLASDLLKLDMSARSIDEITSMFWEEVFRSDRPVILTEGAKKAASLLSNGYIAVSIPGVCRAIDMSKGKETGTISLKADLEPLLRTQRKIFIAFDNDSNPNVRKLVTSAILTTGKLLTEAGAEVRVVTIEGREKGIDDFIVSRGRAALDILISQSKSLADWEMGLSEPVDLQKLTASPICGPPTY